MARKKKPAAERHNKVVSTSHTGAQLRRLKELANAVGLGVSAYASRVLHQHIANPETIEQFRKRHKASKQAMPKHEKTYVQYNQADDKTYYRREWRGQCSVAENILGGECQGVEGHAGQHWSYREDGSYSWWRNTNESSIIDGRDVAGGWTPPDHKDYASPAVKFAEHWRQFFTDTVVTDAGVIALLDADNPPEGVDAGITRPCTNEEIEWLRREGRLP